MLTKYLDNEEINQLPSVLEEPAMASVLKILFVVILLVFVMCLGFCLAGLVFVFWKFSSIFMIIYLFTSCCLSPVV